MPDQRALTSAANGRKSRGPVAQRPKAVPRFNATRHGLLARHLLVGERDGFDLERADELRQLHAQLRTELAPVGIVEELLVERILAAYWRLRRVLVHDQYRVSRRTDANVRDQVFTRTMRKQFGLDITPTGQPESPEELDRQAFAAALLPRTDETGELVRYETALERQFYRAIHELRDLQARRLRLAHAGAPAGPDALPPPVAIHVARVELQPPASPQPTSHAEPATPEE